jgi:hypothetical protein
VCARRDVSLFLGILASGLISCILGYYASAGRTIAVSIFMLYLYWVPIFYFTKLKKVAHSVGKAGMIVVIAFTLPIQLSNGLILYHANSASQNLVNRLEELQAKNLPLPDTMDTFGNTDFMISSHIRSYQQKNGQFSLCYFITIPTTAYCYQSGKGWYYEG